jgi:hypothetical protein
MSRHETLMIKNVGCISLIYETLFDTLIGDTPKIYSNFMIKYLYVNILHDQVPTLKFE